MMTAELATLIEDNMYRVPLIAKRSARNLPACVQLEDLVSSGYVGLVQCVSRFDGRCSFGWYAQKRIRGAMLDYLRGEDLLSSTERRAERAGRGEQLTRTEVPIDMAIDTLPPQPSDADTIEARLDARKLLNRLKDLKPRWAFVIAQYYFRDRTLLDIGADLGVNESRACQMRIDAIRMMREQAKQ